MADQLGCGQARAYTQFCEVERFAVGRMQNVFGDTQSPINLSTGAGFDGINLPDQVSVGAVGADQVKEQENQSFVDTVGIIAICIEPRQEVGQAFGETGFDGMQSLVELRGLSVPAGWVVENLFLWPDRVVENRGGKFLLKKDRKDAGAFAF